MRSSALGADFLVEPSKEASVTITTNRSTHAKALTHTHTHKRTRPSEDDPSPRGTYVGKGALNWNLLEDGLVPTSHCRPVLFFYFPSFSPFDSAVSQKGAGRCDRSLQTDQFSSQALFCRGAVLL